jgi:hypothetical protein
MDALELRTQLLDSELLDVEFVPCGKIDDLELKQTARGLEVVALRVGIGAWGRRLPALVRWMLWSALGRHEVEIPWNEVKSIGSHVQLRSQAAELGLGTWDCRLGKMFRKVPGGA